MTTVNNESKKSMIIAFCGLIGSGKDTAADYLCDQHGFKRDSFANTLKDAISAVFGWDRELIEGRTPEARVWRTQVDEWWAKRLKMPHLTPRFILQNWGTEVFRNGFHDDIWIASLENKLRLTNNNIVISDVRFPNEIKAIHNAGGIVVRVKRGEEPEWFEHALHYNAGPRTIGWAVGKAQLDKLKIHASEYSWVGGKIDHVIFNDTTKEDLFAQVENLLPRDSRLPLNVQLALDLV